MKHQHLDTGCFQIRLTCICSAIAAGLGLFALIGWVAARPWLTALWPGGIPMAPSTALLFVLYGTALPLRECLPKTTLLFRLSSLLGWTGVILSLLLLIFSMLGIQLKAEYLGMNISGMAGEAPVGHMSPLTALCFVIIGGSFLLQLEDGKRALVAF